MEVVARAVRSVVGIEVVADFDDLRTAVPLAWDVLFLRQAELPRPPEGVFVEVSTELGEGRYREVLGVEVQPASVVPEGMSEVCVPAGRFLRHQHEGPVETVTEGFAAMYAWADENGLRLGPWKFDSGYRPGFPHNAHELLIDILG